MQKFKSLSTRTKIIISIAIISALTVGIFVLFKNKIGDLRPVLLSPRENLAQKIENYQVGEKLSFPLSIPKGFKIGVFAKNLGKARDLEFSQEGILLVSDPSGNRVLALPDRNNDGKVDGKKEILTGLNQPHGLAFFDGKLFVAEITRVARYTWDEKSLSAKFEKELFTYPYNGGHSTRSLAIDKDGKLFLTIGSSCNVCIEKSNFLAAVVVSDTEGGSEKLFAKGLRNSVFIKINPTTGKLWGTEMGRDLLGDDTPPEEVNIISDGSEYGWPYCYGDKVHDNSFDPGKDRSCGSTVTPIWKMQAHSAPLGLVFINSKQFPADWQGDVLVAFHGSWNRSVPTGYKIIHLKVDSGKVTSQEDFITGFLKGSEALGRPVDLEFDREGSLYISDDKAGAVYKVSKN